MFVLMAAYFALKFGRNIEERKTHLRIALWSGLAVGAALTVDYVDAILIPVVFAYILLSTKRFVLSTKIKSLLVFMMGSGFGLGAIAYYNLMSFGSMFVSSEQLYDHAGTLFGNFTFPLYSGIFLNLFTPDRGIFLYSPILVLGIWGFYKMMKSSSTRRESVFLLTAFLAIFLPYSAWYGPTGGPGFGPRYIEASIPFLIIPVGSVLAQLRSKAAYVAVYLLYLSGVLMNGITGVTGTLTPELHWFASPFLNNSLPNFLSGSIDTWWKSDAGGYWFWPAFFIITAAATLPLIINFLYRRFNRQIELNSRGEIVLSTGTHTRLWETDPPNKK